MKMNDILWIQVGALGLLACGNLRRKKVINPVLLQNIVFFFKLCILHVI